MTLWIPVVLTLFWASKLTGLAIKLLRRRLKQRTPPRSGTITLKGNHTHRTNRQVLNACFSTMTRVCSIFHSTGVWTILQFPIPPAQCRQRQSDTPYSFGPWGQGGCFSRDDLVKPWADEWFQPIPQNISSVSKAIVHHSQFYYKWMVYTVKPYGW